MLSIKYIFSLIEEPQVKELLNDILIELPEYWWHEGASSTGKYHPKFAQGEEGLLRHSLVVAWFTYHAATGIGIKGRERDLLVAAGLVHDGLKRGMEMAEHTLHEHPILMAEYLRNKFCGSDDAEFMAHVIETHMGKWCTCSYSDIVLPVPDDKYRYVLQIADMLASRPELAFDRCFFDEDVTEFK